MSKVLTGESALPAQPVAWKRIHAGPGRTGAEPPGADAAEQEALRALAARVAELERELPRREQAAFEAGQQKGRAEAQEQAAARLTPVVEAFARAAAQMLELRRRMRREAEEDVVKLALAVARRILHRELSVDPEALLGIVKAALEKVEGREVNCVRVHPEDAPMIGKAFAQLGLGERVKVEADPKLARGSAILDTSRGSLDASVETQLQEIQRGLLDRIRRSG